MRHIECAGCIESGAQLCGKRNLQSTKIIFELPLAGRANDGGGDSRLRSCPVQRYLCHGVIDFIRYRLQHIDDHPIALVEFVEDVVIAALQELQASTSIFNSLV